MERKLKAEGMFEIWKANGEYEVYLDGNFQMVFDSLKEAREWARMMSR